MAELQLKRVKMRADDYLKQIDVTRYRTIIEKLGIRR